MPRPLIQVVEEQPIEGRKVVSNERLVRCPASGARALQFGPLIHHVGDLLRPLDPESCAQPRVVPGQDGDMPPEWARYPVPGTPEELAWKNHEAGQHLKR